MNNERLPETEQGRKVIFDIHCETDKGERIIIEMQNREQPHFKDRALYYLSHSVVEQGIKGTWDYELAAVYGVFFLNFTLDEKNRPNNNRNEGKFRRDIVLADRETGQVFNPKFRQIYIELPRFNKEEEECETDFERWIYVLKHMDTLDRMHSRHARPYSSDWSASDRWQTSPPNNGRSTRRSGRCIMIIITPWTSPSRKA